MIVLSMVVCLVGGFIPWGRLLSIQRTLSFFPFFILGYYSVRIDIKRIIKKIPLLIAVFALLFIFVLVYFFLNKDITRLLIGADPYYAETTKKTMMYLFYRGIYIVIAIIVSLVIMRLVPENKKIAEYGKGTMTIFIFHIFVLFLFKYAIVALGLPQNEIWIFVYAITTLALLTILSRTILSNILLNPISFLMGKWSKVKYKKRK